MSLPTEQHFSPTWSDPQGLGHPPSAPCPSLRPSLARRERGVEGPAARRRRKRPVQPGAQRTQGRETGLGCRHQQRVLPPQPAKPRPAGAPLAGSSELHSEAGSAQSLKEPNRVFIYWSKTSSGREGRRSWQRSPWGLPPCFQKHPNAPRF